MLLSGMKRGSKGTASTTAEGLHQVSVCGYLRRGLAESLKLGVSGICTLVFEMHWFDCQSATEFLEPA